MSGDFNEIQFKDLFDHATDLIHLASPEGNILYANKSWQHTLGFSLEDVVNHNIVDFICAGERDRFNSIRKNLIVSREANSYLETCFTAKDGREILVEGYISLKYENDKLSYTHSILRDVTKRRKEERQLQEIHEMILEREANFQQLIKYAPDAIIVIDEESKITLWNPKSEAIFGWNAEEVTGSLLANTIIPERYRAMHNQGMKRFLSTGEARVLNKTIEITALNRNGNEFNIALTISSATQKGNTIFIAFIRDISEQKKMEEELRLQKQQLENSNEELAQYASIASHDLKEPIRKILTFSDLLLNMQQTGKRQVDPVQMLNKIHSTAERMKSLIESIGKFATIANANTESTTVDAQSIIDEVIDDLGAVIEEKKAAFFISGLVPVNAGYVHVYQLFQNLISNSLKYNRPSEPPVINVKGRLGDGFLIVDFSDNGIGFDNQYAQKVFEPFQRLHGSSYEGTGIGLSICKKIIEAYGGSINVKSEPDQGSTFTFTLPVK